MEFPQQEYWSGLPFPSPGHLPNSGTEPASSALAADSLPLKHQRSRIKCTGKNKLVTALVLKQLNINSKSQLQEITQSQTRLLAT